MPVAVVATLTVLSPSVDAALVIARVPFTFTVKDRVFNPGGCAVSTDGTQPGIVFVRGAVAGEFALVNPLQSAQEVDPKLVFHKYGDQYVLREVWLGQGRGLRLTEPAAERKLRENARRRNVVLTFERVAVPSL